MSILDRQILNIAIPSIVSNITVPLLGLVDLAIVGHLGATAYIAAISLGGMVFNLMYWIFAFLRMGSSGLTAQAFGRNDKTEAYQLLIRVLVIAFAISFILLVAQRLVFDSAMAVMKPDDGVRELVNTYFTICIWGAPPSLCLFAVSGWFLGMQDSRSPMFVAIFQNVVNIIASLCFVCILGMKVEGVAFGTMIAQWMGFMLAMAICLKKYRLSFHNIKFDELFQTDKIKRLFSVNRDIFFRTCCMVAVFMFFTSVGSWQNTTVLAVNTLIMEFYLLFSYVMDGFAFAAEALCGKFYGAVDYNNFNGVVKRVFRWGGALALLFTLAYITCGNLIMSLLTDQPDVLQSAHHYSVWAWLLPFAGLAAFVWDGVFIGITASRRMLVSSVLATSLFFVTYCILFPLFLNHALWAAFIIFLIARGASQTIMFKNIKKTFSTGSKHQENN